MWEKCARNRRRSSTTMRAFFFSFNQIIERYFAALTFTDCLQGDFLLFSLFILFFRSEHKNHAQNWASIILTYYHLNRNQTIYLVILYLLDSSVKLMFCYSLRPGTALRVMATTRMVAPSQNLWQLPPWRMSRRSDAPNFTPTASCTL